MRTFFLFYLLSYVLRNPLLALIIVAVIFYFGEARYRGRYFSPLSYYTKHHAMHELRRTLALNDHDVGAHNDLGRILADQGKFEEALEHLRKAITRMDESPETNFYLGLCLIKTGSPEEGTAYVRKALEIKPRFLYGEPQLALARYHMDAGNPGEALDWARQAVKLNTSSVEGWVLVGKAEHAEGRAQAAGDAYRSAAEAYEHLPRYLKLAGRKWRGEAKRGLKALTSRQIGA